MEDHEEIDESPRKSIAEGIEDEEKKGKSDLGVDEAKHVQVKIN